MENSSNVIEDDGTSFKDKIAKAKLMAKTLREKKEVFSEKLTKEDKEHMQKFIFKLLN